MDPPIFIKWLPGGSAKTRPTGHKRGRPPRTDCETHGKKFCCLSMMDVAVAIHHAQFVYYHGHIDRRDIGVPLLRTTIPYPSLETDPVSTVFIMDIPMIHACCMPCCYWLMMSVHSPNHTPLYFKGGRRCRQRSINPSAIFGRAFYFVYSSLFSYEKECSTIKTWGVD